MAKNEMTTVVKMTIDSKEFETGLQNAKKNLSSFSLSADNISKSFNAALGSMVKKIGLVGIALAAKDGFKQFATSTEEMGDNFQNEMGAMGDAWKSFLFQINNGNFQGFKDIISYARQARQAMDELGDAASLFTLDYGETTANATELLSTIQKKKKAGQDYSGEVDQYNKLVASMREDQKLADERALNALEGLFGQKGIIRGDYGISYMEMAQLARKSAAGAFPDVERLKKAYNTTPDISELNDFDIDVSGQSPVKRLEKEWGRERFLQADFLRTLGNITTEEKEAIEKILTEMSGRKRIVNEMEKRLNRYLSAENLGGSGSGTGDKNPKSSGLTLDQQMQYLTGALQNEILNNDRIKDAMVIDFEIPEEEIIEPETDAIVKAVKEAQERMLQLAKDTQTAFVAANALAGAFDSFGQISDGTLGKMSKGLGSVISQIAATIQAMMALTGAETVEGIADVFANTKGGVWTKLAMSAIALSGIMGIIASAKSSFAGSYANGGIVGGNSYTGDNLWARVNSGEMIIPYNDWHNSNAAGNVHFVIEGSQLKGVLDNYDKTVSL